MLCIVHYHAVYRTLESTSEPSTSLEYGAENQRALWVSAAIGSYLHHYLVSLCPRV